MKFATRIALGLMAALALTVFAAEPAVAQLMDTKSVSLAAAKKMAAAAEAEAAKNHWSMVTAVGADALGN